MSVSTARHTLLSLLVLAAFTLPGCFFLTEEGSGETGSVCQGRSEQSVAATPAQCEEAGGYYTEGRCYCP